MRCASRSIKASVLDEWVLARARELFPLHGTFSADLLESDSDRAQESAAREAGKLSAEAYMELAAEGRAERTAALAQMDRAQQEHAAAAAERVDPAQAAAWHAQLDPWTVLECGERQHVLRLLIARILIARPKGGAEAAVHLDWWLPMPYH